MRLLCRQELLSGLVRLVMNVGTGNFDYGTERMRITSGGNVGIGAAVAAEQLSIGGSSGNIFIGSKLFGNDYNGVWLNGSLNPSDYNFLSKAGDNNLYINRPTNAAIAFRVNNLTQVVITPNGNVGIGTESTNDINYRLYVEKGIRTRKIKVDQLVWADYVFDKEYHLPSIAEVEQFIQQNKHLKDIPSAQQIELDGLDLGNNQALLLKKIEELTLYLIQQDKKIGAQQKRLLEQDIKLEKQQREIDQILKLYSTVCN